MAINLTLYTPYNKQRLVHKYCNDKETFFITVNAGRQSGKSMLSINQSIFWALSKKNQIVYWVSPTAGQASKVYKQMLNAVLPTELVKSYKGSKGDTEIVFHNGSVITFRSGAQEDSLRGESVNYMIIDEAAFIKEDTFKIVLLPFLNVTGKKCLIVSTPKGKNWYYYHYLMGINGTNDKYKSFQFNSSDNPYSNEMVIDLAKQKLPQPLFAQEYLAEFVDAAAIFENIKELSTSELITSPVANEQYFIGVDIGMKNDFTVAVVLNKSGEMVSYDRFTNLSAPLLKQRLKNYIELWKPKKTYLELNNQGLPIFDDLIEMGVKNLEGFTTTSSSKPEIINNLINAFASKEIKILNDPIIQTELESFTMVPTSTGKVKFQAPDGFHDDICMALAIAWECKNKNLYKGTYTFISV